MKNLISRLQEPSSYGAFAILFYAFFPDLEGTAGMEHLKEIVVAVLAGASFLMKERGES